MVGVSRRGKLPTVKEVAQHAGVSPMTVSRTLAGGANVRPDLQERVLAAVSELGYRRNENARTLRPGQASGLIGVAITNLGNPYYGNFALGVEEAAAETGRRIVLGNTGGDPARERQLVADFLGRQVEGLVLVPSGGPSDHLRPERLGDVPLVLASRRIYGLDVDVVLLDDVGGAYRGTLALLDAGHKRIGYLGNVSSAFTGTRRYEGYLRALEERGIHPDPDLVRPRAARCGIRQRCDSASSRSRRAADRDLQREQPEQHRSAARDRSSPPFRRESGRDARAGELRRFRTGRAHACADHRRRPRSARTRAGGRAPAAVPARNRRGSRGSGANGRDARACRAGGAFALIDERACEISTRWVW